MSWQASSKAEHQGLPLNNSAHFADRWHIMFQQIFNALLQCRRGRRASGACPAHMQGDNAVFKAVKNNVTAILRDSRAHPCIENLFDDGDHFGILFSHLSLACIARRARKSGSHERTLGNKMFHNGGQNGRFYQLPFQPLGL